MSWLLDLISLKLTVDAYTSPIRPYFLEMRTLFGKGWLGYYPTIDCNKLKSLVDQYDQMNSDTIRNKETLPEITRLGTYNFNKYNNLVKIAKTLFESIDKYNIYGSEQKPHGFWAYLVKRILQKYDTLTDTGMGKLSALSADDLFEELKNTFFSTDADKAKFTNDFNSSKEKDCTITLSSPKKTGGSRKTRRNLHKKYRKSVKTNTMR